MKKYSLLLILIMSLIIKTNAKVVRFAVNVSNTTVAQNDVYMTSNFQTLKGLGIDFQSGFLHMTQHPTDTNIYYYTIDLPAFQLYEYQMEKGATGYEKEWVPVETRSPNDYRWIYLDSLNADTLKLPEVKFGDNNTVTDTMYRFQVNMISQSVSTNGVHIEGAFQGSNPATSRMYSFANGIYEYMAWLAPGTMQHFKYINGNTSSNSETVPTACAMGGYRMISSVSNAQILPVVCFNSCANDCYPLATSNLNAATNSVSFFPNPMHENATIVFNDNSLEHQVKIIDMLGRNVKEYKNIATQQLEINKQNLSNSMYYLQIENNKNETTTLKIVVE